MIELNPAKRIEQHNTGILTVAVFVISLHVLLILSVVASYLPSAYTSEVVDIFYRGRPYFPKNYDLTLYRVWIVLAIALAMALFFIFKKDLNSKGFRNRMVAFIASSAFWLSLGYWAAFEFVVHHFYWPRVVLGVAIVGNLISWLIGFLKQESFLNLGRFVRSQAKRWAQHARLESIIAAGAAQGFILRIGLVITAGLLIFNHQRLFFSVSLPYFLPLRFALVGIFTWSFIIPISYMALTLGALGRRAASNFYQRRAWYLTLGICGLMSFLIYVRFPIPSSLYIALWPLVIAVLLFWRNLKELVSLQIGVSVVSGIQAGLLCVWGQEHLKTQVLPADFSSIVYGAFIFGSGVMYWILSKFNIKTSFSFLVFQGTVAGLGALAWFKLVVYDYRADLARWWFMLLSVLMILQPILWPMFCWGARKINGVWESLSEEWRKVLAWSAILILIVGATFVPNVEALTAHIFFGEYTHHCETYCMGPAWAVAKGAIIDVDVYSRYGIGSIPFYIWVMKLFGGLSYVNLFKGVVWVCTFYFILTYVFYYRWLKNNLLALASWMMAFKAQIAFELAFPIIFTYPQSTVARQWPDIVWMILMLWYMESENGWFLALASITTGFAFWYMPSVGCYMLVAHTVMAGMVAWQRSSWRERIMGVFWPSFLAVVTAVILFLSILGHWFFSPVFWHNAIDFMKMFLLTNTVPLTDPLIHGQFLHTFMFCVIVFAYMFTILKVGLDYLRGGGNTVEARKDWLAFGVSIYGLGILEHYVTFSMGNNYYSKTVPFFLVSFHWLLKFMRPLSQAIQKKVFAAIAGLALIALLTNHSYMSYPNALNISSNPLLDKRVARPLPDGRPYFFHKDRGTVPEEMRLNVNNLGDTDEGFLTEDDFKTPQDLVTRYNEMSDFTPDASLIASLTSPQEKVALISSYEVRILMQANRRPLFFIFPLLASRPMRGLSLPNDMMDAKRDLQRMLDDMQKASPRYVFMEKVMSRDDIPSAYSVHMPGLMILLHYVKMKYVPFKEGQFLIAYKRKE